MTLSTTGIKRWNDWGTEGSDYRMELSDDLRDLLTQLVGPGRALPEATLQQIVARVPPSRLPEHPLIERDAETRVRHARGQSLPDWLAMHSGELGVFPDGVARPESREQVVELLRFAADTNITVIPYGGGTSVAGHINPLADNRPVLTVSLTKMNKLLALDKLSQIATFGAGTAGPAIEAQLQAEGYTLGHYPQSWELSTLGGWVAARSSGQQSLRYGRIEQMFAGGNMETLAGQLEIPPIPASSAGPDLREMVLGSEGRMGIITEVKVRVTKIPEQESFHVCFFPSWQQGLDAVRELAQERVQLSMLRLSNALETESLLNMSGSEHLSALNHLLESQGLGDGKVMMTWGLTGSLRQCEFAGELTRQCNSRYGGVAAPDALGDNWAHGRFRAPYLREPLGRLGYLADTMETAINWDQVTNSMEHIETAIRNALADESEQVHAYTHLSHVYGQGCSIYTTYLFRCADDYPKTFDYWQKLKHAGASAIVACGGTISHQHGVGYDHRNYLPAEKGEIGIAALRSLCSFFDPDERLNPGKLLPDGK